MPADPIRPTGCIFDCDGTLTDTMGLWEQMEVELARMANHQITPHEADLLRGFTLPETGEWFHGELGLGASGRDVVEMIEDMACDYYATRAAARPGVADFLRAICDAGVVCSVASSSPHSMLDCGIVCAGLAAWIPRERIVSVDDVGVSKLQPDVYDEARRRMGTALESTWVFEDAVYAVRTARTAGYPVCGVYDRDDAGTLEQLASTATIAIPNWPALDVEKFLSGQYI